MASEIILKSLTGVSDADQVEFDSAVAGPPPSPPVSLVPILRLGRGLTHSRLR